VKLQRHHSQNNHQNVQATPHIDSASIDAETKILSIKGHGFATALKNNKITYMYADHTVVTPKVKMISIQNTSEGQEIKVQILDNYTYGFLTLTSGEQTSNEVNVGPAMITRIERRMEFVKSERRVMGVLYISGKNFGTSGGVKVGRVWATTHYRSNVFIIAVVEPENLRNNPVIVTKK
jgi:cellobiose-specific phosphotransferase system component IIB